MAKVENSHKADIQATRAALIEARMPKTYWNLAYLYRIQLAAILPNSALGNISPDEKINNKKPCLKNMKIFGCKAIGLPAIEERPKLDKMGQQTQEGKFVGYDDQKKYVIVF